MCKSLGQMITAIWAIMWLSTNKHRGGKVNISDVAKKTGLTSKAIRFYEEKGLVTPPLRSDNGYRTYNQQHLNELTLLRQARQVGFNLEECGELVTCLTIRRVIARM